MAGEHIARAGDPRFFERTAVGSESPLAEELCCLLVKRGAARWDYDIDVRGLHGQ